MTTYARKLFSKQKHALRGAVGITRRFNRRNEIKEREIFKMETITNCLRKWAVQWAPVQFP